MMITATQAASFAAAKPTSYATQSAAEPDTSQVEDWTKVAISSEALQKASESEGKTADPASPYRLTGAATLVSSLNPVVYQMPDALIKEMEVRAREESARNAMNAQYASTHASQTVGQVLVNGKLVAEVNDAGGYGSLRNDLPGLSQAQLDPRARVEEIAQAMQGQGNVEVRYSDFVPGLGGWGGPAAPESMLPSFTARNIHDIFAEAIQAAKHLRSTSQPPSESAAS